MNQSHLDTTLIQFVKCVLNKKDLYTKETLCDDDVKMTLHLKVKSISTFEGNSFLKVKYSLSPILSTSIRGTILNR